MSRKRISARIDAYRDYWRTSADEKQRGKISLAGSKHNGALSKARHEHVVSRVMDRMRDWRATPFENEAPIRYGLRSALCLHGASWSAADDEAAAIVASALSLLGIQRPTWDQGQREYVIARENCSWCAGPIAEEDRSGGRSYRFCSTVCARSALRWREVETNVRDSEVMRSAMGIVLRSRNPQKECEACGERFHPSANRNRFCSARCKHAGRRTVPERDCQHCGTTFRPRSNALEKGRYCSDKCSRAAKAIPQLPCQHCGRLFRAASSRGGRRKFCSPECKNSAGLEARYPRMCSCCHRPFMAKLPGSMFCSVSCKNLFGGMRRGKMPKRLSPPAFDYVFRQAA